MAKSFFADLENWWCIPEYKSRWTADSVVTFWWGINSRIVDDIIASGAAADPCDFCLSNIRLVQRKPELEVERKGDAGLVRSHMAAGEVDGDTGPYLEQPRAPKMRSPGDTPLQHHGPIELALLAAFICACGSPSEGEGASVVSPVQQFGLYVEPANGEPPSEPDIETSSSECTLPPGSYQPGA